LGKRGGPGMEQVVEVNDPHGGHRQVYLLRYTPENIPSPRVVRAKWLMKN
jgi:hypothetical protein